MYGSITARREPVDRIGDRDLGLKLNEGNSQNFIPITNPGMHEAYWYGNEKLKIEFSTRHVLVTTLVPAQLFNH